MSAVPTANEAKLKDHDIEVPANVAELLVDYVRSNTIRNEQAFLLLQYGWATAFLKDPRSYNSGNVIGTSSSGKTHLFDRGEELYEHVNYYAATSGSATSMIYDEAWDSAKLALLDELQKPPDELIEFLKSVHGGDEKFIYKVTQGSAQDGFETETIEKKALPYWFLYAQWDADFEMWNRLLKIPVHESESKNRAVGKMAFDHSGIKAGDMDVEYGYDFEQGTWKLKQHIRLVDQHGPFNVYLPRGERYDFDVWDIVGPIFSHSRSEVNRIYHMVANEIRGSTALNYHTRDAIEVDGKEYLVATPQDVANVLRCRQKLLATTHELDQKRRAVVDAIETRGGKAKEVLGMDPVVNELEESDAPSVKKSELENIFMTLEDNYVIEIHEDQGEGGTDIYESKGWDELGYARVDSWSEVFEGVTEPINGLDFQEWHADFRTESGRTAQEMMEKGTSSSSSSSSSTTTTASSGDSTLNSYGGGMDETPELDETEEFVLSRAQLLDGERIEDLTEVPVGRFIGLDEASSGETAGTPLDPEHQVWDRPNRSDTWIQSEQQARRELKEAIDALIRHGFIDYADVHRTDDNGSPIDATLAVSEA